MDVREECFKRVNLQRKVLGPPLEWRHSPKKTVRITRKALCVTSSGIREGVNVYVDKDGRRLN